MSKPLPFHEARDAYLREYYLMLGAIARFLRLRRTASAFVLLAQGMGPPRRDPGT